jgi:hypothetical protein
VYTSSSAKNDTKKRYEGLEKCQGLSHRGALLWPGLSWGGGERKRGETKSGDGEGYMPYGGPSYGKGLCDEGHPRGREL